MQFFTPISRPVADALCHWLALQPVSALCECHRIPAIKPTAKVCLKSRLGTSRDRKEAVFAFENVSRPLPHGRGSSAANLPRYTLSRARGYSLMEVMFAIAVLAVGLIAIASLFPVGLIQQKRAIDDAQGVIIGNNVLASIRASRFTAADFTSPQNTFTPITDIVTAPIDGDKVKRIVVLDGGSYGSAPTVIVIDPTSPAPTTSITATANMTGDRVTSITFTPGSGYKSPPLIRFSGNGGARAKAYLGTPSDFVDTTGTYDYALAYRHPAGGPVEVAVFVYRTSGLTADQPPARLTTTPFSLVSAPGSGSAQTPINTGIGRGRNQMLLIYKNSDPTDDYAVNLVQDLIIAPMPPLADTYPVPFTAMHFDQAINIHPQQKALSIVTGVVR